MTSMIPKLNMNRPLFIVVVLFFMGWFPRVLGLDQFVTSDEHKWLARSANFYQAIYQGNLLNTFQRGHPGVTVMWAGTLGFLVQYPEYVQETPGQFVWKDDYLEQWLLQNTTHKPLDLLVAGRWWIVLAISLALALNYFPLRHLLGEKAAFLALLFVIWEPFNIALSRQLHPDGLAASLMLLALTTFLAWLEVERSRHYLIFSALIMSLAWLTKSPTILLVPMAILFVGSRWLDEKRTGSGASLNSLFAGLFVWGMLSVIIFVVLWPAMWLDPIGTLTLMEQEVGVYIEGHSKINYFLGQRTADPGVFFYPVVYLFRTTALALLGLLAAILLAWQQQAPFDNLRTRRMAAALSLFAFFFIFVITLGAKKFDRYLLPAILPLDILAALGGIGIAKIIDKKNVLMLRKRAQRLMMGVAIVAVLLGHGLPGFLHYPYYLSYYNWLVGGSVTAPYAMMIGWGEGLDQVGRYLNSKANAEQLIVSAWYTKGPFSYFFNGQTTLPPYDLANRIDNNRHWLSTDYVVFYANQWQRELPTTKLARAFAALEPESIIKIGGLEYARIYNLQNTPITGYLGLRQPRLTDWGNSIRLMAYEVSDLEAGGPLDITFYLRHMAPMEQDVSALVRLVDTNKQEWGRSEGWPSGRATSSWRLNDTWPDTHQFILPTDAPPTLAIELSFYEPTTLEHLPATDVQTGSPIGQALLVGELATRE